MNRSTSRRSMASGECSHSCDSASLRPVKSPAGSACSCQLAAHPDCALAAQKPEQWIGTQLLMVVQGPRSSSASRGRCAARASAPRCARHALPDRVHPGNSLPGRLSRLDLAVHLAQQRRTAIAGHLAGGKTCLHTAPAKKWGCKCERFLVTLLSSQSAALRSAQTTLRTTQLCHEKTAFPSPFSKSPQPDINLAGEKSGLGLGFPILSPARKKAGPLNSLRWDDSNDGARSIRDGA